MKTIKPRRNSMERISQNEIATVRMPDKGGKSSLTKITEESNSK